jgi:hypothetical protein
MLNAKVATPATSVAVLPVSAQPEEMTMLSVPTPVALPYVSSVDTFTWKTVLAGVGEVGAGVKPSLLAVLGVTVIGLLLPDPVTPLPVSVAVKVHDPAVSIPTPLNDAVLPVAFCVRVPVKVHDVEEIVIGSVVPFPPV